MDYARVLHKSGHRLTSQREAILDAICEGKGHSTLGVIYSRARRKDASLDKSTVYRSLLLFQELGLVVAASVEGEERRYEIAHPQPHHHFVCKSCKREFDIEAALVDEFYQALFVETGLRVTADHLMLSGLCADCQKSSPNKKR